MRSIRLLRVAWGLLRSDDRLETVAAIAVVLLVVGPVAYELMRENGGEA